MTTSDKPDDFREIAHSGGTVTFTVTEDRRVGIGFRCSRPNPVALIEFYALPDGQVVESIVMGGIGHVNAPPTIPNCITVMVSSDSEGRFGHHCPRCRGYWRSGPLTTICTYCGLHGIDTDFLSDQQRRYMTHYCKVFMETIERDQPGMFEIDMDAVADAASSPDNRPAHFVSDESQQRKFVCKACDEFNDIIGRYGFCSRCGTRSDLAEFEEVDVPGLRERLAGGDSPETCLREAVAAFDSFAAQYARQLAQHVRMTSRRKHRLMKKRFQDVEEMQAMFEQWFDINIADGLKQDDLKFATLMFHRRHLYEHTGGEVDDKYLRESGDDGVRLKERIRESLEDVHRLLGIILRMARNLHEGFHAVLPPREEPIKGFAEKKARIAEHERRR